MSNGVIRKNIYGFKEITFCLDECNSKYPIKSLIYDDIIDVYKIEYLYNTGEDDESVC